MKAIYYVYLGIFAVVAYFVASIIGGDKINCVDIAQRLQNEPHRFAELSVALENCNADTRALVASPPRSK